MELPSGLSIPNETRQLPSSAKTTSRSTTFSHTAPAATTDLSREAPDGLVLSFGDAAEWVPGANKPPMDADAAQSASVERRPAP